MMRSVFCCTMIMALSVFTTASVRAEPAETKAFRVGLGEVAAALNLTNVSLNATQTDLYQRYQFGEPAILYLYLSGRQADIVLEYSDAQARKIATCLWATAFPEVYILKQSIFDGGFEDRYTRVGTASSFPPGVATRPSRYIKINSASIYTQILTDAKATEQQVLQLTSAKTACVRVSAVQMLTDRALLAKMAVSDADAGVRWAAVEKLAPDDQTILAQVALRDKDRGVRRIAVEKLTDQALLARIAAKDRDESVRIAAQRTLNNLQSGKGQ